MENSKKVALLAKIAAYPEKILQLPLGTAVKFTICIGKTDKVLYAICCEVLYEHYGELATFHLIKQIDSLEKTGKFCTV